MGAQLIPIPTHPGLLSGLVGADRLFASAAGSITLTRVTLTRQGASAGDAASFEVRNAAGGGGQAIAVAFAAGSNVATATGALVGTVFYLRGVAVAGATENLAGHAEVLEVAGSGAVTAALTTLARVRAYLARPVDATADALITDLINGVSLRMLEEIGHGILEVTETLAPFHGNDRPRLVLDGRPVLELTAVQIDGIALAGSAYEVDSRAGLVWRLDGGEFPAGVRNVRVSYRYGYAAVPESLVLLATKQVAFEWRQTKLGGDRLGDRGTILDAGGSTSYLTGAWAPGVRDGLDAWRARELFAA